MKDTKMEEQNKSPNFSLIEQQQKQSSFAGNYSKMIENENSQIDETILDNTEKEAVNNIFGSDIEEENQSIISINSAKELIFILFPLFICPDCKINFKLKFINLACMTLECKCKYRKNLSIEEFDKKYKNNENFNYGCEKHEKKNYEKYCTDCREDLCAICLEEKTKYNNYTGIHKRHENHDLIYPKDISKEKKEIEEIEASLKNKYIEDEYLNRIKEIIKNVINLNDYYPCYRSYKTLKVFIKFLNDYNPKNCKEKLPYQELVRIGTVKELKENIEKSNEIYKIIINGENTEEKLDNFNIFKNKGFNELVRLQINNLKIKDISVLVTCSFPILKKLIIGCSELKNDSIDIIKNMKLPNIKFISLFDNKITSPEIFSIPSNFENLEKFYIGFNYIDINLLSDKNKKYYFPKNLKELGLTNCFTHSTNHFIIDHLGIENIRYLFVNECEFSTLKPFAKIKFNFLEQFWVRGREDKKEKGEKNKIYLTDIRDMMNLNNKVNIKKFVAKGNRIKNIEELVNIIPYFKNLELLNLEYNGFDEEIDKEKIEKVKNELKKKGFDKLEVIFFKKVDDKK